MAVIQRTWQWLGQPQEAALNRQSSYAPRIVSVWDGARDVLLTQSTDPTGAFFGSLGVQFEAGPLGIGRGAWFSGSGSQPYNLPAGSFGSGAEGTRIAIVQVPTGTGTYNLSSTTTGGMQLRVTGGSSFVFVKRGTSVRITATSTVSQGEYCVLAGSFGASNKLYKNGNLVGAETGNLVTIQPSDSFVGSENISGSSNWNNGLILFHVALDRQLSDAEMSQFKSPQDVWNEFVQPQQIYVPTAAPVSGLPTLSASTFVPGSVTSTGWRPRVTATY